MPDLPDTGMVCIVHVHKLVDVMGEGGHSWTPMYLPADILGV